MREPPILTTELTLQLERCIAPSETPSANANAQIARFGKTIAFKVNGAWPPSAVFCFNSDDVARLNEILAFFGDIDPIFYLVHGGFSPELARAMFDAGYYMAGWKQIILYGLPAPDPTPPPPGVTIELVTPNTIDAAAEVAAQGNAWHEDWKENAKNTFRQSIHRQHYQLFLARYEGQPAGVGDLSKSNSPNNWCSLGGGAVAPHFRCKGIHTALLQHRLHVAFKLGYELVVSGADFGSTSFRNQQRAGLRLAFIEASWIKRK